MLSNLSIRFTLIIFAFAHLTNPGATLSGQQDIPRDRLGLSIKPSETIDRAREFEFDKRGGVVYRKGEDFQLTCDVYIPHGDGPFPAVLAVHGGAWRGGTKLHWFRHARKIARAGYVVVAINYRHAPKYKFPAQIHDCKAAVRWMRKNANDYKIDVQRIGGVGYSAGGHLVSLLGTTDVKDRLEGTVPDDEASISTRLQAVVAGAAPCEFGWVDENSFTLAYWLGNSPKNDPQVYVKASPINYISADDPPFYFFQGSADRVVPTSCSEKMHRALLDQGIESELKVWKGYGHFGLFSKLDAIDPAVEFLNHHLKQK